MKTKNRIAKYFFFFLTMFLSSSSILAQGWERIIAPPIDPAQGYATALASHVFIEDTGYMVFSEFNGARRFMHVNENGYETSATPVTVDGILIQDADENFVYANRINANQNIGLYKVDDVGALIWSYSFSDNDPFTHEAVSALIQSSDGDYVFAGASANPNQPNYISNIYKVDENGDVLWHTTFDHDQNIFDFSLVESSDGGYLMVGSTAFATQNQPYVTVLIKFDANGNLDWTQELSSEMKVEQLLADNDTYVLLGRTAGQNYSSQLMKIDNAGNEIWIKDTGYAYLFDLIKTNDGGYAVLNSGENIRLIKTDIDGNTEWEKSYGGVFDDLGYDIKQTDDEGFIIAGYVSHGDENTDWYLIKTDENGVAFTNIIEGYVQYDVNEDCINDFGEQALEDWVVTAEGNAGIFYAAADSNGYYFIEADTGDYEVSVHVANAYWESCVETEMINLDMNFDTTQVDFAIQSIEQCPLMEVTMMAGALRICEENTIYVNCQNTGTWIAEDAYVEITFDDSLEVIDASVGYSLVSGNTYSFEIGDIDFLEWTSFTVDVLVGCSDELLGQTLCSEALVFPDTSCFPIDSFWTGASVEAKAWCENNEVKLRLKNVGTASMQQALEYIVVEDDVIMDINEFGPLQVEDSILITEVADGTFYRIESPQEPFHPGLSMPSAFIEGCGEGASGEVSLGFVNLFPLDDLNPWIDLLCSEVVASYDPNIKEAFPIGYDAPHYIEQNTELEYVIHFQNTGTAPAYLVVLQDVLSRHLDPSTIQPGVSSHPYDFELFSNGIVKFTFENIMLPDSTTNEADSHGFVQFKIQQKKDLPIGTEIHNEAAIYFDANAPIITNQTWHTIGEDFITVDVGEIFRPDVSVKVYPNPFNERTTFEVEVENAKTLTLQLYDTMGRTIRLEEFSGSKYQFYKKGLSSGIYFYSILDEEGILNSGKVIVD